MTQPKLLHLRDYQEECVKALDESHATGVRRPAVVLPTGAGKTVVFSARADTFTRTNPGKRVLILAHTDELVAQAASKLRMFAPHLKVGIVKAARNEVTAQVIVASVQSLRNAKRRSQLRNVGLVIVDECHHATATTYQEILEHYGALGPKCTTCDAKGCVSCGGQGRFPAVGETLAEGFTATLARGDKAKLSTVWEDVAFKRDISFMIRRKYLLDVRGKRVEVPDLSLRGIKTRAGDYAADELGEALTDSLAPEVVAKAYVEHASDRSGLVFTPNVASAYVFRDALVEQGIKAEVVHGALPTEERRLLVKRLDSGDVQVLVNCMVLTEGFDSPIVSCVVIARPTKSGPLYQQMVGRALRLYEGQTDALVMDVVGASRTHGLASLVDLTEREIPEDKLEEGLSLIELEDLEQEEDLDPLFTEGGLYYQGPVEVTDFDPLARDSRLVWKRTQSGVNYLSMGKTDRKTGEQGLYVFLVPAWDPEALDHGGDMWSAVWCTGDGSTVQQVYRDKGLLERPVSAVPGTETGVPLSVAVSRAEDLVEELSAQVDRTGTFSKKAAPWRKRRASSAQASYARRLGVSVPTRQDWDEDLGQDVEVPALTAGELSDLIDSVVAAKQIDRWVAFLNQQR